MGKEWYWPDREDKEPNTPGCMSGMWHLIDFHNLLFTTSGRATPTPASPPLAKQATPQLKGVEAPRNSIEIDFETAALSSVIGEELFFNVPLGIQIVPTSLMEERRSSQSGTPRTPSLVARLMGLEVLPNLQPSTPPLMVEPQAFNPLTTSKTKKKRMVERQRECPPPPRQPLQPKNNNVLGDPRSLPETPRPSSVRSWEADPRLSLQLNKENKINNHYNNNRAMQEFSYLCEVYNSSTDYSLPTSPSPRLTKSVKKECRRGHDENKSPHASQYSEIVKQAKENIGSRRVISSEERAVTSRRPTRTPEKPPSPSQENTQKQPLVHKSSIPQLKVEVDQVEAKGAIEVKPKYERYTARIKKKPASPSERVAAAAQNQLSRLDQKRCKPVPLLVAAKQHNEAPRRPLSPRPVQEPMYPIRTLKSQQQWRQRKDQDPEFRYVRAILEHAGLMSSSNVLHSLKWHSPSLPLNPIIFLKLELNLPRITTAAGHHNTTQESLGSLRHRCNRRLLFSLVQEILTDLLLSSVGGEPLLLRLWLKIRNFPGANCRFVGDIDALVEGDMPKAKVRGLVSHPAVAEAAEGVVVEIERSILELLVGEVVVCLRFGQGCRTRGGWR